MGEKGKLVRCTRDCETCEYAAADKKPSGCFLSLDGLMDAGFDIADPNTDIEREFAEREEKQEIKVKMQAAIAKLSPRQQKIVRLYYYEEKTEREIAEYYGVTQQAINNAMRKILSRLKKII